MNIEGRLLGNRYEIIEKIGNGGMATVYKAKCHVLNRYVAVKILRDEFTTDEEFIKRFEVEAQSAASITHPNIVSVYDVGKEGNLYYIVMELIKGKTLKEIITQERGALPWKWSVNIAIQIASALEVAHKNNIIHRDIKPHNIIITEDGIAKVTDFGIAKAVSNSTITAFGTTIGSVHYFSPEHARGGYTDAKSDLYSLGVVMYEMLTGKVPFDADTPVSIALKHMQEEPIPPIEKNSSIPLAVNNIIMKALQKDTQQRYETATEMLRDLNRALKEPEGNFVNNTNYEDSPTQRISVVGNETAKRGTTNKKQGKFKQFIQKHKVLVWITVLIILFALSLGGTMLYFNLTKPKEITIPNLIGKTSEEAEQILTQNGLKFEYNDEEYSTEYPEGQIMKQDPAYKENSKASTIKEGSTIKLTISKGTEVTTVPKVAGMKKEEAIETLKQYKLTAEVLEETSKDIQEGYVTRQETEPETVVNAGDTVKIYVSIGTGLKQIVVPSVKTKNVDEATKTLSDLGLIVTVEYEEDTTKNNGTVLNQSISSGSVVDEGTTIVITVNQIAELKYGTVKINLKSLLNYKEETDENGEVIKPKDVKLEVKVTSEGKEETVYNQSVSPTRTDITANISGKGTIIVKVFVNDVKKEEHQLNLNAETTLTLE
ncbi:MAG: Stk1 family PASTA domain-containing Ser/Thr kinase [Clostridia bacterium]|nr:Stk1 family PASTA domain-containing Ser/Thr kinase [Clostridia bacterium]